MGVDRETGYFSMQNSYDKNSYSSGQNSHNNMKLKTSFRVKNSKMKGQMFIAGAVLVLVIIISISISLKYSGPEYDRFFGKNIENIDNEARFASFAGKDSLKEFFEYLDSDAEGFNGMYAIIGYDLSSSNITIGNFLGSKTKFLIESGSFNQTIELDNRQTASLTGPSNSAIFLSYKIDSIENREIINLVNGKTTFVDIMVKNRDLERRKSIYYQKQ